MSKKGTTSNGSSKAKGTGNTSFPPTRWLNVSLSEEDALELEADETTLDELALSLVSLAIDGAEVSLKLDNRSGSHMAVILFNDPHNDGGRVGVSGFGDSYRDAILVVLYKWYTALDATIPLPSSNGSGRRFR